jgi:dihydroxyacetone kinase-like protein
LSLYLSHDLGLTVDQKFSLVAIPILSGALLRIPLGMLADHLGSKRTGQVAQLIVIASVAYAWLFGLHSLLAADVLAVLLGLGGASFAVALPQASRWYPPKYQGVVMGIAGAGNMGVVIDSLLAPALAEHFGWQAVFGLLLIPLILVLIVYSVLAKDAPERRTPVTLRNYRAMLADRDTWWFMFFYSITFGGFVGLGMLDAAAPGEVFTSPVPDQMLAATKAVDGGAGVVHIVKNYTGDILNFKLAAEDAADEGIKVTTVVIDDDVAVQDSLYTAGRRGVGATVLAEKIAGAAAEGGADLAKVTDAVKRVNDRARSFGVALSSCIPPGAGKVIFELPEGEIEFGIGIHGEPGRRRAALGPASEVVDVMVEAVISDLKPKTGSNLLVFLNGMGGTPLLELYLLYGEVDAKLRKAGLNPTRNLVGSYITSLEMAGASLTVLELDDELTKLWDAPVHTAALRWRA